MPILKEEMLKFYPEEGSFLSYVQTAEFPWFFQNTTLNFVGMCHTLMHRYDGCLDESGNLKPGETPRRGTENSPHLKAAEELFLRTCAENNVTVRTVYRAAFNRTFHEPFDHADIHTDHMFPHKVFILYIYARDGGDTLLFADDGVTMTDRIAAQEGKFVIFEGGYHAMDFCKPQSSRVVLVITFDGDVNE